MSSTGTQLSSPPEKGTAKGEFFHREESPFREVDEDKRPTVLEAEDELETNDVQFRALKQDVLLQMFEPGLQDDKTFPSSGNLFALGNRSGCFACGRQKGLIFGKNELLRAAFEEAKPKSTASLKNAFNIDLPETPTHIRFNGDEKSLIVSSPSQGMLILDCAQLQQKKSAAEATRCSFQTGPLLELVPNPSPQHAGQVAYITRIYIDSPYGNLFLHDVSTNKSEQLDSGTDFTCLTFSHDGDILMACTRTGDALYFNLTEREKAPIRRPPPVELPQPEGDTWWIIQGVHWVDTWNQLVIYNPLTHPSDDPVHEYQAYVISNSSRLAKPATFNFEFIKLPSPPVDAFGNNALRPWFWFQNLHNWKPGIQDLVLCSVTAGSDIGLLGRGTETDSSKKWRVWSIEDENWRATVPYNMEKNEETIVVGMQLDYTATKKLEKPLYPNEDPLECDPLPILWVLNTSGQLAGWTVMYIPGIKGGERPVSMIPIDWQIEKEEKLKKAGQVDEGEQRDAELLEKEGRSKPSNTEPAPAKAQPILENPSQEKSSQEPSQPVQTPIEAPVKPTPLQPSPESPKPSQPSSNSEQPSHPAFGKPSQLTASTFGQTGQLGGTLPGQSSIHSGLNTPRPTHVFGQSTGLGAFGSSTSGSKGGGFAKYTSSQSSQGSGLLSGQSSQSGSFLQNSKGGSFLQGGQTSSFLQGGQDQGFGKYATNRGFGTPRSMTTPSSFSDGGFLANRPSSSPSSPFGDSPKGSLSQRTQLMTSPSSRTQSYDILDDDTDSDDTDVEESGSDEDNSVRVDALNFGDTGFNLDLDTQSTKQDTKKEEPITPVKQESLKEGITTIHSVESPSSVEDNEYVKVDVPITPSPRPEKSVSNTDEVNDLTPSARDKSQITEVYPAPVAQTSKDQSLPGIKSTLAIAPKSTTPFTIDKAITPPDPFSPQLPRKSATLPLPFLSSEKASPASAKDTIGTASSARNKVELRPFVPISGTPAIYPRSNSTDLSDAFRLVIEQVSKELEKLSNNANTLSEYIEYQSQEAKPKSAADLGNLDDWTFANLETVSRIVESDTRSVEESVKEIPAIDESIQELEKSLKKMEAKRLELNRFVQAVRDPLVRESIYSRKLAPDFARQQKEIRHSLQIAEEKLRDLASALTILKVSLADDKGSFGVHSPSTAGIYRIVNNVIALEERVPSARGARIRSPGDESIISRSSVAPTTPVTKIGGLARSSPRNPGIRTPGMNSSPNMRGSPLRKTMLDEKLDPWEMEEVIQELNKKDEFRKKIGSFLKVRRPLFTEASSM